MIDYELKRKYRVGSGGKKQKATSSNSGKNHPKQARPGTPPPKHPTLIVQAVTGKSTWVKP